MEAGGVRERRLVAEATCTRLADLVQNLPCASRLVQGFIQSPKS
ncbi:hypothetical protein ES332_D03G060700v1 [Gossypium tomentosum]|uniref:Uncharacterized protein n=1 Tax=Gossypium tomentosum TaxID=34277 RepID=A0A5D2LMV6_GOSTO|nr:hypothetical protein ES332_D03G060700v1 [Gossypium tomentosum]